MNFLNKSKKITWENVYQLPIGYDNIGYCWTKNRVMALTFSFDLSEELSFTIELEDGNYNSFEIKDGYVKMISASCPDKICLHTKGIYYDKETITCLPNRVLLQVSGGESSEIDAVVN